jgi:outer membrane protein TolC
MALKKNLDIEIARYSPLIEDKNTQIAQGEFDTILTFNTEAFEQKSLTFSWIQGQDVLRESGLGIELGLGKKYPIGLSVNLGFSVDYAKTNSQWAIINPRYLQTASLSINLPLLKGAGLDSNYATLLVTRKNKDISLLEFEQVLTEQVLQIQSTYWQYVYLREYVKVQKSAFKVAKILEKENKQRYERGLIPRVDYTSAKTGVAMQKEALIKAENELTNIQNQLKRLINPNWLFKDINIIPVDKLPDVIEKFVEQELFQSALKNRPDYIMLTKEKEKNLILRKKYKNSTLPKVDFQAGYSITGMQEEFRDAYTYLGTRDYPQFFAGVVFEFPIENRSSYGEYQKILLNSRLTGLKQKALKTEIKYEIKKALNDLTSAQERVKVAKEAEKLAKERFEVEQERLKVGAITTFQARDAHKEYLKAQVDLLKAKIDLVISQYNLYKTAGLLLKKQDIKIQEHLTPVFKEGS